MEAIGSALLSASVFLLPLAFVAFVASVKTAVQRHERRHRYVVQVQRMRDGKWVQVGWAESNLDTAIRLGALTQPRLELRTRVRDVQSDKTMEYWG